MKVKRNKPAAGVTFDSDVLAWLKDEAERLRCKPSHLINRFCAEKMEESLAKKADGGSSRLQSAG